VKELRPKYFSTKKTTGRVPGNTNTGTKVRERAFFTGPLDCMEGLPEDQFETEKARPEVPDGLLILPKGQWRP
jgi:hypothetical protein